MPLTPEHALRAYATMLNTLDASHLVALLADDFHYTSQWALAEIGSRREFLDYIAPKLANMRSSGSTVWAEMGWLGTDPPEPCVLIAQGERERLVALVLARVENGQLQQLALCGEPSPHSARRSGDYPGRMGT